MSIQAFKYLTPFVMFVGAYQSFTSHGLYCFMPLIYAWIIIPALELMTDPDTRNLLESEADIAKSTLR